MSEGSLGPAQVCAGLKLSGLEQAGHYTTWGPQRLWEGGWGQHVVAIFRRDHASKFGHEASFYLLATCPAFPRACCVGSRAKLLPQPMKAFSFSENSF